MDRYHALLIIIPIIALISATYAHPYFSRNVKKSTGFCTEIDQKCTARYHTDYMGVDAFQLTEDAKVHIRINTPQSEKCRYLQEYIECTGAPCIDEEGMRQNRLKELQFVQRAYNHECIDKFEVFSRNLSVQCNGEFSRLKYWTGCFYMHIKLAESTLCLLGDMEDLTKCIEKGLREYGNIICEEEFYQAYLELISINMERFPECKHTDEMKDTNSMQ